MSGAWITVLIVATVACAAILALGSRMCWRAWKEPEGREELGIRLLTGAVVAVAILGLQVFFDQRLSSIEDRRRADEMARNQRLDEQAARQSLRLTIGIQPNLQYIDLSGRDLASFYLGGKNLRGAHLVKTNLRKAILARANLTNAILEGAHLEGAHLDNARLKNAGLQWAHLQGAVLSQAKIGDADFSYADLRGADLETAINPPNHEASFTGVIYDTRTRWPKWPRDMRKSVPRCGNPAGCQL
jgi:uncharacterized protein YjbI with pentapeptide repeats